VPRANRLWDQNLALATNEPGAWTRARIEREADELDQLITLAPTAAARRLPSFRSAGGRMRVVASSAVSANLEPLLCMILDALRAQVDTQREIVSFFANCVRPSC
jgi:ABC-type proline/glycine betaine transport system ATPase subunit